MRWDWVLLHGIAFGNVFGVVIWLPGRLPGDFGSFYASGLAAARGLDPYGVYELTGGRIVDGVWKQFPNLNPPICLLAFEPLSRLDLLWAYRAWFALSLVIFGAGVLLLARAFPAWRARERAVWALALAGLWQTLLEGQVYALLLLLCVGAWVLMRHGRTVCAGLVLGVLVAIKPNYILWPLLLLLAGHRRVFFVALGSGFLLSILPLARYGPQVYQQWLTIIARQSRGHLVDLAGSLGLQWLGLALVATGLAALCFWAWRSQADQLKVSALALTGCLTLLPWTGVGYTLTLYPVLFSARPTGLLAAAAWLLVVPMQLPGAVAAANGWPAEAVAWPYYLAGLLALAGQWRQGVGRPI